MKKVLLVELSLLLVIAFTGQPATFDAYAQFGGVVCIMPEDAVHCLEAPSSLTGPITVPPSPLRVSVFVENSDAINGFDIIMKADHTLLQPVDVDLMGSVLPSPIVLVKCIGGILQIGNACPITDTLDTIHLSASALSFVTTPPTSGLLFTAIYNITGPTSSTTIGFQTGCAGTSVEGGVCVTISNGIPDGGPVPERAQVASFYDMQDFTLSSSPTSLSILPSSIGTSTIILSGQGGFDGDVALAVTPSSPVLIVSLAQTTLHLTGDGTFSAQLSVSSSTIGSYGVVVVGTSTQGRSHSIRLEVTVSPTDFAILGPASLVIFPHLSKTAVVSLTGLRGSSTITLSAIADSPQLSVSLSTSTVTVEEGRTSSVLLTLISSSGTFTVTVTGTSDSILHTKSVDVTVGGCDDVNISGSQDFLVVQPGSSVTTTISVNLACGPGTVNLETIVPMAQGITASLNNSTRAGATLTVSVPSSVAPGNYILFVHGTRLSVSSNFLAIVVRVPRLGDVNGDFIVNIIDFGVVVYAYGSRPGDPRWFATADFNNNGAIDIIDAGIVAYYFGTSS